MFRPVFWFELTYWFRSPSFYFFALILFFLAMLTMGASAGMFGAANDLQRIADSPINVYSLMMIFNKLILFVLPAIVGNSIYRDFKSRTYQVMYTFPLTRWDYLGAKFFSSLSIIVLISAAMVSGLFLGTQLPGTNEGLLVHTGAGTYVKLFGIYLLPDIFLFGSLVFAIVTFSRNIYTGFIMVVLLLTARELVLKLLGDSGGILAALAEPLGETATSFATGNWTLQEQNVKPLPFTQVILFNRVVWLAVACSVCIFVYRKFSFRQLGWSVSAHAFKSRPDAVSNVGSLIKIRLAAISFNFNWLHQLRVMWRLSQVDFRYILRSGSFISMVLVGAILLVVLLTQMNPRYETRILPVTWVMLAFPVFFFSLLVNFLTFLYTGMLIHRARTTRMNELIDVAPVSNTVLVLSKLLAVVKMQIVLLGVIFLSGLAVQVSSGYYEFEIGHYMFDLFVIHLVGFIIWAMAAIGVHSLISNFYVALFILILGFFGASQLSSVGLDSRVFQFNQDIEPGFFLNYSNMSGHGHSLVPYFVLKGYWFTAGFVLLTVAVIAWIRGTSVSLRERMVMAAQRLTGRAGVVLVLTIVMMATAAFTVRKMENSIHVPAEATRSRINARSDRHYGHLVHYPQPRIIRVDVAMNLFPELEAFESTGVFTLVNKTGRAIDTLLVNYSQDAITEYTIDRKHTTLLKDSLARFDIHHLTQPLVPGDSLHLSFRVRSIANTALFQNSPVLANGTFITSLIYPGIGYYSSAHRSNKDSLARQNHYRSIDSDYISFSATVSTSGDQTAFAPGYLVKQWSDAGRNFFRYQSTAAVTNDYAFTSGRYHVLRDRYKDINLEIYYHPGHHYNVAHMMEGLKWTLAYSEKFFGPYQHKQARIIEYSRKAGDFAQSFSNTIPMSERNFIMDIDESNPLALNLSFLGTSHELAHQWWGHQVIPADVNGSRLVTESVAEYVSLCLLEERYGREKGRLFRKKALDIYLKRRVEDNHEQPLIENSGLDKPYIPYQKGSLALYAMRNVLGEGRLNSALRTYLGKVKFQQAPYTIPEELVSHLELVTPDSLQYLIDDLFRTVTLYDNRMLDYDVKKLSTGKYQVTIDFMITKFRSEQGTRVVADASGQALSYQDGQSVVRSLPLNDYIEIGVFSVEGEPLHLKMHLITRIKNRVTIVVDELPGTVAIDPFTTLLNVHTGNP